MKTILHTFVLLICCIQLQAQTAPLNQWYFAVQDKTFEALETPNLLEDTPNWGYQEIGVPIGFEFQLEDEVFTELAISTYGSLYLVNDFYEGFYNITPMGGAFMDHPSRPSALRTKTEGEAGSQKFIISFEEFMPQEGTEEDFLNFQVILHEGSNRIEFLFGEIQVADPSLAFGWAPGAECAIYYINGVDETFRGIMLGEDAMNPTVKVMNDEYPDFIFLEALPTQGISYIFSETEIVEEPPLSTSENILNTITTQLNPNPADDFTNLNFTLAQSTRVNIQLFNTVGKLVHQWTPNLIDKGNHSIELPLNHLESGLYFIKLTAGKQIQTKRLRVVHD